MPPELHLRPDRLFAHAAVAAVLSEELRGALPGAPALDGGLGVEQERLCAAVGAAARELAELSAALACAATAAGTADAEVSGSLRGLREELGPEQA